MSKLTHTTVMEHPYTMTENKLLGTPLPYDAVGVTAQLIGDEVGQRYIRGRMI